MKFTIFLLIDIDECKLGSATCSADGSCTNTVGSYSCQCNKGFSGDGKTCIGTFSISWTPLFII